MMYRDKDGDGWVLGRNNKTSCFLEANDWVWYDLKEDGWEELEVIATQYRAEVVLPEEYMK